MSKEKDYTHAIANVDTTNIEEALAHNIKMQKELLAYRQLIQNTLKTVQDVYNTNEELIKNKMTRKNRGFGIKGAYLRGGTFFLKGNMFFKDLNCRNCPNNKDYEYRQNREGELFPMDLELCGRHVWSLRDKQDVVNGVKEQVIQHLTDTRNIEPEKIQHFKRSGNEKLVTLLSYVTDGFHIDWQQISKHNLRRRHSATSCEAIWNVYLNPVLKRTAWTMEENKVLLEAAKAYDFQNWAAIAAQVGKRSDFQCFVQYQNNVCYMLPERWTKWSKRDDKRLVDIVAKNTFNNVVNWNNVMAHFPHKPKTTIQARYSYTLNPHISHAPFTPEEDLLLLAAVEEYGTKFSCLPKTLFPHRTVIQLRSRYKNTILHRNKLQPWSVEDDKKLMDFVSEHGTSSWLQCQDAMGNHTRTSCRTRYLTIKKFFEKNPNTSLEDIPRKKNYTPSHNITPENWVEKLAELKSNPEMNFKQKRKTRKRRKSTPNKLPVAKKVKHGSGEAEETVNRTHEQTPCRKKPIYVKRLRNVGLQFYDFFKYAFNFQLGDDPIHKVPENVFLLKHVSHLLDFPLTTDFRFNGNLSQNAIHAFKNLLELDTKDCVEMETFDILPPNWSSAMAFRALCVLTLQRNTNTVSPSKELYYSNHSQIVLFRKRLRILLYSTTLLSRLHPSMVGIPVESNSTTEELHHENMNPIRSRSLVLLGKIADKTIPLIRHRHGGKNSPAVQDEIDIKIEENTAFNHM